MAVKSADQDSDYALLEAAVREAGALALGYYFAGSEVWKKQDYTPVSEADLAVDRLLKSRLLEHRPGYGWLSEESEDSIERLDCNRVWIADSIDGTRAFVKNRPWWSISVALVEDGEPVLGVVYAVARGEFYAAVKGRGAYLNGRRINVSSQTSLSGASVLSGHCAFRDDHWPRPWPKMQVEQRNSVAYRLALVALGEFDAAFAPSEKNEWDLAAGDLIVKEAGGILTGNDGRNFSYNESNTIRRGLIAAPPALHAKFLKRVKER